MKGKRPPRGKPKPPAKLQGARNVKPFPAKAQGARIPASNARIPPNAKKRPPGGKKPKAALSEFERYKLKLERGKRMRVIMAVTLLTVASAALVALFGSFSDSEFGADFRTRFTKNSEFPVAISGSVVRQMEPLDWSVLILDDANVMVYNDKGIRTLEMEHGYAAPVLQTAGEHFLLYDQGGKRFKVATQTRELFSGDSANAIHAADIAQNGTFAIATSSSKSAAEIKFYNELGTEIFTWQSTSTVSSLTLSPDGRQAAVCLLGAENGALVSSVALLDLQNPKLEYRQDFPEEFVLVALFGQDTLLLLTDQSAKALDKRGRLRESYDYGGRQILQYADGGPDRTVIVLGSSRYLRSSEVVTLDGECGELGKMEVDSRLEQLRADGEGFTYLSDGVVERYDYECRARTPIKAAGVLRYCAKGQNLYVASYEQLQKLMIR